MTTDEKEKKEPAKRYKGTAVLVEHGSHSRREPIEEAKKEEADKEEG